MAIVDVDDSGQFSADWVASFDGPSAFLATLLILHFCCVLVKCFCYMENKLSLTAQVDWLGMRVGGHPALSLHSSDEPGELSQ